MIGLIAFHWSLISAFVISMMNWDGMGAKKFIGLQNFVSQLQDEVPHRTGEHGVLHDSVGTDRHRSPCW